MPRPKREDAETRILEAGIRLFSARGSDRVHSNTIARRAGVGIGTFYSHFRDKHELLSAIELRTLEALRGARLESLRAASGEPLDQVRRSAAAAVAFAERHPEAYRVCFGRERFAAKPRRPLISESSRPIAEALRRLQRAGSLSPALDPDLAARAYAAMESGLLLWWLEDPSRADSASLVDTLCEMHPVSAASIGR